MNKRLVVVAAVLVTALQFTTSAFAETPQEMAARDAEAMFKAAAAAKKRMAASAPKPAASKPAEEKKAAAPPEERKVQDEPPAQDHGASYTLGKSPVEFNLPGFMMVSGDFNKALGMIFSTIPMRKKAEKATLESIEADRQAARLFNEIALTFNRIKNTPLGPPNAETALAAPPAEGYTGATATGTGNTNTRWSLGAGFVWMPGRYYALTADWHVKYRVGEVFSLFHGLSIGDGNVTPPGSVKFERQYIGGEFGGLWKANDTVSLGLAAGYNGLFRFDKGVGTLHQGVLAAHLRWQPTNSVELAASLGAGPSSGGGGIDGPPIAIKLGARWNF